LAGVGNLFTLISEGEPARKRCGLYAPSRPGGLASRSPRCSDLRPPEQRASRRRVGGRVARRRRAVAIALVLARRRLVYPDLRRGARQKFHPAHVTLFQNKLWPSCKKVRMHVNT